MSVLNWNLHNINLLSQLNYCKIIITLLLSFTFRCELKATVCQGTHLMQQVDCCQQQTRFFSIRLKSKKSISYVIIPKIILTENAALNPKH